MLDSLTRILECLHYFLNFRVNDDCSFGICTVMYAAVAVLGYMMFGESTQSQFTLNMPQELVASKVAVWTTVCGI